MIKLIATDMDGTLLNDKKELPPDFEDILKQLNQKNIKLIIASGRQYYTLINDFKQFGKDLVYIAENGSLMFEGNRFLASYPLDKKGLTDLIHEIRKIPGAYPILCGKNCAYGESENERFRRNAVMYYNRYKHIDNIESCIEYDDICKIAIFDSIGAENNTYKLLSAFKNDYQVILSGESWVDIMEKGVNKGRAMKKLQQIYGAEPSECMAFGDYMNDYELMKSCEYSYAMENAHPDLKAVCNYSAPSNNDCGVTQVIRKLLL